jgi:serine/threonine-protein kinase RsbW
MNNNITIACSKENLINIRKFINDSLSQIKLRTTHLNLIVLAIDEICSNRIIHSNQCNHAKQLQVTCNYTPSNHNLQITIKDQGNLFKYENYTEPTLEQIIKEKEKGGIGLLLVRKIMDNITYTSDKDYNITTLTKKINPQSLAS